MLLQISTDHCRTLRPEVARHDQSRCELDDDTRDLVLVRLMKSTRVSSVLTDAWSDPRTAVDYCLRFFLYPDRWLL